MDFTEYIKPELLVLIPALYGLGSVLKNAKTIKDKYIPVILSVISLTLTCIYVIGTEGVSGTSIFTGIIQGLLCVASAVYTNQLIKQSTNNE